MILVLERVTFFSKCSPSLSEVITLFSGDSKDTDCGRKGDTAGRKASTRSFWYLSEIFILDFAFKLMLLLQPHILLFPLFISQRVNNITLIVNFIPVTCTAVYYIQVSELRLAIPERRSWSNVRV